MNKSKDKIRGDKGLCTLNPNHLKYNYDELFIEVLGGINIESYSMLRVMLVVRGNRKTERDHVDLYQNFQLTNFIKRVAETTSFSLNYVDGAVKALIDELEIYRQGLIEAERLKHKPEVVLSEKEKKSATSFLSKPQLLKRTNDLIEATGVVGNQVNRLVLFLLYLSKMQQHPLHAIIQSKYNYLQKKIGELIPDEQKKVIRHLSENVLFYFQEYELSNKLLLIEDKGSNKTKLNPLIDFQTDGEVSKLVTQKDSYGKLIAKEQVVKGPVAMSISTPQEDAFKNNAVLSFSIEEDQSKAYEEQLLQYQRKQHAGLINPHDEQKAKDLLWNIQRVLEPYKVINSFAQELILPEELQHKQITNAHYLRFIEVIALFMQFQKEKKVDKTTGEMYIEVDIKDIEQANDLLSEILLSKCDNLSTKTRAYFERLKQHLEKSQAESFTNNEIFKALNIPISTIKRHHSTLLEKGYISKTGEGNRAKGYEYTISNKTDYSELKSTVETSLKKTIKIVKGSSKLKVAQNQNEPLQPNNSKALTKVAQNKLGVHRDTSELKKNAS